MTNLLKIKNKRTFFFLKRVIHSENQDVFYLNNVLKRTIKQTAQTIQNQ